MHPMIDRTQVAKRRSLSWGRDLKDKVTLCILATTRASTSNASVKGNSNTKQSPTKIKEFRESSELNQLQLRRHPRCIQGHQKHPIEVQCLKQKE